MASSVFTYLICVPLLELLPRPPLGNEQAHSPEVHCATITISAALAPQKTHFHLVHDLPHHLCYCEESIISINCALESGLAEALDRDRTQFCHRKRQL